MIALMKRILSVSGPYQGRIKLAFVFAFLKAMLSKAPIGLSFLALSAFLQGTMTARLCLWLAVGTVGCVLLECLCQNIADRLQAAAGYMVFAYGIRRSAHGAGAASAPPAHGLFHRGQHRQNQFRSVHRHGVY